MKGIFRLGHQRTEIIEFDEQTSMMDVYGYILEPFKDILPHPSHIEFYSFERRKNLILDDNLLNSRDNPFRSNLTNENVTDPADCVLFVIIDDSPQINSQSSMSNFSSNISLITSFI